MKVNLTLKEHAEVIRVLLNQLINMKTHHSYSGDFVDGEYRGADYEDWYYLLNLLNKLIKEAYTDFGMDISEEYVELRYKDITRELREDITARFVEELTTPNN